MQPRLRTDIAEGPEGAEVVFAGGRAWCARCGNPSSSDGHGGRCREQPIGIVKARILGLKVDTP